MTHAQGLVNANVLFVKPQEFSEEWARSDLWQSASDIPGVKVLIDDDGIEAARFGSLTSGQAMLYNADRHLVFSGGITASRGHAGDNEGRSAILSWLTTGAAASSHTAVFGCPLFKPGDKHSSETICDGTHPN